MQIVSGDIARDITGEIVYLKAYKQMVGLIKTSERRQSIRSVRGGVEHGSRIIKAGIYSLYHSGSRIIGSRYTLV